MLLREMSVETARRERRANDIATLTGLSVAAVRGRLTRAHGRTLLRNAFVDVWPAALEEIGQLPATKTASDAALVAELAKLLQTSPARVRTTLDSAKRGADTKSTLAALWAKDSKRTLDQLGSMRTQEARLFGLASQIADAIGAPTKDVRKRLDRAHGLSLVGSVFAGLWPMKKPSARSRRLVAQRYEHIRQLGEGAMGVVWLARDVRAASEPLVALKYLRADARQFEAELLREFDKAALVTHPHVCKYLRAERDADGLPFLVIEYGGTSLREKMKQPVAVARAIEWISAAAEALDELCEVDIWHLDVKPENLLIDDKGVLRLTDFGVAMGVRSTVRSGRQQHVPTSTILGWSPQYAAPELLDADPCKSSDQYSLALTCCELVGGPKGRMDARRRKAVAELSPTQNKAVQRALSDEASKRFPSCSEFAQALGDGESWTRLLEKRWKAYLGS